MSGNQLHPANHDDDPDSIFCLDETRKECGIRKIENEICRVSKLTKAELKEECSGDLMNTAPQCRARYLGALRALRTRWKNTTNIHEGGSEYVKDLEMLEQFQQHLMLAGLGHIHNVSYGGAAAAAMPQSA